LLERPRKGAFIRRRKKKRKKNDMGNMKKVTDQTEPSENDRQSRAGAWMAKEPLKHYLVHESREKGGEALRQGIGRKWPEGNMDANAATAQTMVFLSPLDLGVRRRAARDPFTGSTVRSKDQERKC